MTAGSLRVAVARVSEAPADIAPPAWLCESELARWPRLSADARTAFVASRALVRGLLQASTGVPFEAWQVCADAGVAPLATAPGYAAAAIHVSLSHRLGWVAAAVGETAVGIDVEVDRAARSDPDERASLMLARDELAGWRRVPAPAREAALLARWTAKEAWFKASPTQSAPWDFRLVRASACAAADANVRAWRAAPVHVALCCADARALAAARCEGLPPAGDEAFWRVGAAL